MNPSRCNEIGGVNYLAVPDEENGGLGGKTQLNSHVFSSEQMCVTMSICYPIFGKWHKVKKKVFDKSNNTFIVTV